MKNPPRIRLLSKKPFLNLIAAVALLVAGVVDLSAAATAYMDRAGGIETGSAVCEGVFLTRDPSEAAGAPDAYYEEDVGPFAVRIDTIYPEYYFSYTVDLLRLILPPMIEIVGPPSPTLDTLTVRFHDRYSGASYYSLSRAITIFRIHPDSSGFSRRWDNVFIHELVHAFQDDFSWGYPSWLREGIAEAGRHFVSDFVSETTDRNVRDKPFDKIMASYDLSDAVGEQILAGSKSILFRVDTDLLYQNAAGCFIVPSYAELGGAPGPHPLAKLNSELRVEIDALHTDTYRAIDRAWSVPIDGMFPPSRWIRSRAVTCPSPRDGEFVAVRPAYTRNNVSPSTLRVDHFERVGEFISYLPFSSPLRYIDANHNVAYGPGTNTDYRHVPDLPDGAYLVEIEEATETGKKLVAQTWILVAGPPSKRDREWDGIAAVFVDKNGIPVDIPRNELTVNALITASVPGGVIVKPRPGTRSVTFRRGDHILSTVTVAGKLKRMVVVPVATPPLSSVVEWTPYHPAPDQNVTVLLDLEESSLDPAATDIMVLLYDLERQLLHEGKMHRLSADPTIMTATFAVPEGIETGDLQFTDGISVHGWCRYQICGLFYSAEYSFAVIGERRAGTLRVDFDGKYLTVEFDDAVSAEQIVLKYASDPGGLWLTAANGPIAVDGSTLRWDTRAWIGSGVYVQLSSRDTLTEVMLSQFISPVPSLQSVSADPPYPNPSSSSVSWPFQVEGGSRATFRVFDVMGRLVYEEPDQFLHPGTAVFRWSGTFRGEPVPAGVYFLQLRGDDLGFTRKVVVVR